MKKLICVMTLVCIGILLVSCGSKRLDNPKAQFIRDFGLNIDKKTSLDKGTQRKTTENELPSLTQCTA